MTDGRSMLAEPIAMVGQIAPMAFQGTAVQVLGLVLRVADLPVPVGSQVRITPYGTRRQADGIAGEVIGFDGNLTVVMPLGTTAGIRRGDKVVAESFTQHVPVGAALLGRVLNAHGRPIDGRGPLVDTVLRPLVGEPIGPLQRPQIDTPLATGIRAIDAFVSVGRGQRVGVFAAPGVGKSILLGSMARHTEADVTVVALVGERGREVGDFLKHHLGPQGLDRSVVICATSDEPALVRCRAALAASAIAEYFRDQQQDVLLIMDSLTRFCHAQRQIGLSAGEPPATRGYPPSVFAMVPRLLERTGRTRSGSITGFYAVLVEGDDMDDPVADSARSVLDGHIVLSRKLAHQGHWPAIDLVESVSRLADQITGPGHQAARRQVLRLIHHYGQVEELLHVGAYAAGSNPEFDLAIACKPAIDQLVQQGRHETIEVADFQRTRHQLDALTQRIDQTRKQLTQTTAQGLPQPAGPATTIGAPTPGTR